MMIIRGAQGSADPDDGADAGWEDPLHEQAVRCSPMILRPRASPRFA
jgi:hypothetical protein